MNYDRQISALLKPEENQLLTIKLLIKLPNTKKAGILFANLVYLFKLKIDFLGKIGEIELEQFREI